MTIVWWSVAEWALWVVLTPLLFRIVAATRLSEALTQHPARSPRVARRSSRHRCGLHESIAIFGGESPYGVVMSSRMLHFAVASLLLACVDARSQGSEPGLRRRALWRVSIAPPTGDSGARVRRVEDGSPAARAGLRAGDAILTFNGRAVATADEFWPAFDAFRGGDTVRARLRRSRLDRSPETLDVRFVLDTVPREAIPGTVVTYDAVRSGRGYRVRTMVTRPAGSGQARLPAIVVIPWLSCDPVEKPNPGSDGMARMLRDVSAQSGMMVMRVEKPGVGDSEGPNCRVSQLEDELAAYRSAIASLRRRADLDTTRLMLLGLSIGGGLAPILAAEDPSGIAGVISVGGFTRTWYEHMLDIERRRLTLSGAAPAAVNSAMRGYARFYTDYLIGRRTPGEVLAAHRELATLWYDEPGHQYGRPASYFQAVQSLDVEAAWLALADRGVPALIVWGEYDWIMGRAEAARAVEIVNGRRAGLATLAILPKTDHGLMTFASQAAAFTDNGPRYDGGASRVVTTWLNRIVARK